MNNTNGLISSLTSLAGFILIFIAFIMIMGRVDTYLHNQSVSSCNQLARIETNNNGVKIGYPAENVYKDCMNKMK